MPQPSLDAEVSFLSDGDSSSSDSSDSSYHPYVNQERVFSSVNQCKESEDQNASQQRRKLLEGQSSRTGALSTHVEQRAYNLRPRKDDLVTIQRRSKFARLRQKQQNQRRNKRQQEIRDHEDFMHNLFWIAEKEPAKTSDQDFENRIEVITDGTRAKMGVEWSHYFEASDNGLFTTTLKGADWKVEKMALQAGPSVVGLQSFTGDTYLFSCSGTIVEFFEESTMIVTVANLVKCPDAVEVANNLKVQSPFHLPGKRFSSNVVAVNFDKICSRDVVTLGRSKDNRALLITTGKIIPKSCKFDCDELLVSTCRISKVEVGGPLMDFDGNFIGMNYYHAKETPFVPSFIVLKCLQQFKLFGAVIRPWLGLRVRTLHAEGSTAHEKMQTDFHGATGVVIEKIEDFSSAKESGLNEGDIINQVNGVYISNAAELGGILLDITTTQLMDGGYNYLDCLENHVNIEILIKVGLRSCKHERTMVTNQIASGGLNKWPFPKPIIVKTYGRGELKHEEWFACEFSSRESSASSTLLGPLTF